MCRRQPGVPHLSGRRQPGVPHLSDCSIQTAMTRCQEGLHSNENWHVFAGGRRCVSPGVCGVITSGKPFYLYVFQAHTDGSLTRVDALAGAVLLCLQLLSVRRVLFCLRIGWWACRTSGTCTSYEHRSQATVDEWRHCRQAASPGKIQHGNARYNLGGAFNCTLEVSAVQWTALHAGDVAQNWCEPQNLLRLIQAQSCCTINDTALVLISVHTWGCLPCCLLILNEFLLRSPQ